MRYSNAIFMNKENFPKQENKTEQESIPSKEVWIIDDVPEYTKAILRLWEFKFKDSGFQFRCFDTALSALAEIEKRRANQEKMPGFIFIDGQLEKDTGDLKEGVNFVKKVRALKEIQQPKLIANSSDRIRNNEMLKFGADQSFSKAESSKAADFLKESIKDLKPQGFHKG